jgi:hypothetical protein
MVSVEGNDVFSNEIAERQIGLIGSAQGPALQTVPSIQQSLYMMVECPLSASAGKIVPNSYFQFPIGAQASLSSKDLSAHWFLTLQLMLIQGMTSGVLNSF